MRKMKKRLQKKTEASYIEVIAIIAILAIVGLAALGVQSSTARLEATFETVEPICLAGELPDIDIRAVGTSIIITEPIQTPNPCYSVGGEAMLSGRDIEVNIRTTARPEICIQCVGVVTARVTIQNIPAGVYGLKVNAPGRAAITTITVGNP